MLRGVQDVDPEAEGEEPEAAQPVFKTLMPRPRYKTNPLHTRTTATGDIGESPRRSIQNVARTPISGTMSTPSPKVHVTQTESSIPPSFRQSHKLRSQAYTREAADK